MRAVDTFVAVLLVLVLVAEMGRCTTPVKPVTNEDIRDAILSVVHMIRSTEDKLERHEYRERALGDQIKKALTTIDKRQKILDPVKGTLSRIDERLAAVETILMQKDERERIQLEKTNELVSQLQKNLPQMFERLKNDISIPKGDTQTHSENSLSKADIESLKKEIEAKINGICHDVVKNVEQIRDDNKNNTQLIAHASKNIEDVKQHHLHHQNDKNDILQELQKQKTNVDQILTNVKTIAAKVPKVAEVTDLQSIKTETLKSIEQNHAKLQKTLEGLDTAKSKNDLQPKILQTMEQQKTNIDNIHSNVKALLTKLPEKITQPADLQVVQNEVVKSLDQIKKELLQTQGKIEDYRKSSEVNNGKLQKAIENGTDAKAKNDLQPKILQVLEKQAPNVDQILSNIKTMLSKIPDKIAQASDVQGAIKLTEQIKKDLGQQAAAIADAKKSSEQGNAKLQKAIDSVDAKTKGDSSTKILQAIEQQKGGIDQILSNLKSIAKKVPDKIAEVTDIQAVQGETLKSLEHIKQDLIQQTSEIQASVDDLRRSVEQSNEKLVKTIDGEDSNTNRNLQLHILKAIEQQKSNGDQILSIIKRVPNRIADAVDVQDAKVETLRLLDQIKNALVSQTSNLENKIDALQKRTETISDATERKSQNDIQPLILQALELQKQHAEKILSNLQTIVNKIPDIADVENVKKLLSQIQNEVNVRTSYISDKLNNVGKLSEEGNERLHKAIVDSVANNTRCEELPQILQAVDLQGTRLNQLSNSVQSLSEVGYKCDATNKQLQEIESIAKQNNAGVYKTLESITQKDPDLQPTILQAIETQHKDIEQLLANIKAISTQTPNSETTKNETLQSLQQVKDELLGQGVLLTNKISALHALSEKNNENLQKTIIDSGEIAEQLNANVASSFEKLSNSVRSLSKLDQIMLQVSDAISDTKKRVEYGVHQISLDVGNVIKRHSKDLNSTINARFDNLELTLLQPEVGALSNLSSHLAGEIDQVWRQIGIMHEQMGANTDTLERIQTQTDTYINGSATTMDNMRGKVVQITSSMAEVDDNLNYLLGRLSLVTQEFNRIKSGLGEALDQIKSSFNIVKQKIKETGPGPHQIESSELQSLPPNPSPSPPPQPPQSPPVNNTQL